MKHKFFTLFAIVALSIACFAQEIEIRDAKSMKKFVNSQPKNIVNSKIAAVTPNPLRIKEDYFEPLPSLYQSTYNLIGFKYVSLQDVDRSLLNPVEIELVDNFFDVLAFNSNYKGYLIIDDDFRVGYANFRGDVIIEPMDGTSIPLTMSGSMIGFGNSIVTSLRDPNTGWFPGTGDMRCVLDADADTLILSPGQYDFIAAFAFGTTAKTQYVEYLVGKNQTNGELLFGLCDRHGKEIVPCEYKSIVLIDIVKKEYRYSKTESIESVLARERERKVQLAQLRAEQQAMYQAFEASMQSLSQSIEALNNTSNQSAASAPAQAPSRYTHHKKPYSNPQAYQTARHAYQSWASQIIDMKTGKTPYNASNLNYMQHQMKNIRTKWESKGMNFSNSPELENWNVK